MRQKKGYGKKFVKKFGKVDENSYLCIVERMRRRLDQKKKLKKNLEKSEKILIFVM